MYVDEKINLKRREINLEIEIRNETPIYGMTISVASLTLDEKSAVKKRYWNLEVLQNCSYK